MNKTLSWEVHLLEFVEESDSKSWAINVILQNIYNDLIILGAKIYNCAVKLTN